MNAQEVICHRRGTSALTISELLVLVAVLAVLVSLVGPKAYEPVRVRVRTAACARQLQSIGVAFLLYSADHGNLFPNALLHEDWWRTNCDETLVMAWQRLSNELANPRLLVCPGDTRYAAINFGSIVRSNLSYFMSLDAAPRAPQLVLAGDRNLSSNGVQLGSGLFDPGSHCVLGTTREVHRGVACLLFADGSVNKLRPTHITDPGFTISSNRLAIP